MDESALVRWADGLAADLGVEQRLEVVEVLKLAADAAHGVMRPAAPVTTFLVGLAIGQANGDPARVAEVLQTVRTALDGWNESP